MSKKPTPAEGVEVPPLAEDESQAVTAPPSKSQAPEPAPPAPKEERDFSGALLKELREAQNLTIREISDRTKITAPILTALEEERFESVPAARVYVRGFVRAVARELSVDMDQVARTYVPRWERWYAAREGRTPAS